MTYLLPDTIKNSANRFPEKVGFRYQNESLTFEELVKQSNNLAFTLVELCVKRGDSVGVFLYPCFVSVF